MSALSRETFAFAATAVAVALMPGIPARAKSPTPIAIEHVRIVTAGRPVIAAGTIVIRDGRIAALGAGVIAPADAVLVEGRGLTAYPGLIDLGNRSCVDPSPAAATAPAGATFAQLQERKRARLLRPHIVAGDGCRIDRAALQGFAEGGVTTALVVLPGEGFAGRSVFMETTGDASGSGAPPLLARQVATRLTIPVGASGIGYPDSLMGMIAFVRQTFLDAQHRRDWIAWAKRTGHDGPPADAALDSLLPAIAGEKPVVIEAGSAREIRRALSLAREFTLDAMIAGGVEAGDVADDLAAARALVLFGLRFPTRPRGLAPDADEPIRILRQRVNAPSVPRALAAAGVTFGFASDGLANGGDFLDAARRTVSAGLGADAALRALTVDAARIVGVAEITGSLEVGKRADVLLADGDLFASATKVRRVFIGGRPADSDRK